MILERREKADREQKWKEAQRETKKNLKDVTQEEDGEMVIRKQQHNREQNWKATGREQKKSNTNFDMVRTLNLLVGIFSIITIRSTCFRGRHLEFL